jgi:hypothetical protein
MIRMNVPDWQQTKVCLANRAGMALLVDSGLLQRPSEAILSEIVLARCLFCALRVRATGVRDRRSCLFWVR